MGADTILYKLFSIASVKINSIKPAFLKIIKGSEKTKRPIFYFLFPGRSS
jgi:hypothetical protein